MVIVMQLKQKHLIVLAAVMILMLLAVAACKKGSVIVDEAGGGEIVAGGLEPGDTTQPDGTATQPDDSTTPADDASPAGDTTTPSGGDDTQSPTTNPATTPSDSGDGDETTPATGPGAIVPDNNGDDPSIDDGGGTVIKIISQNVLMDGKYNNTTKQIESIYHQGKISQADTRRPVMKEVLTPYDADSMGFQEVTWRWKEWLKEDYPGYTQVGIMRYGDNYKGNASNELDLLMYKTDKFELIRQETIWLSDTPYVEASKTWGGTNPCTFVYAHLKLKSTGEEIVHFTTHFSHDSDEAKTKSGPQMSQFIYDYMQKYGDLAIYATGDYNIDPNHSSYNDMTSVLQDPYYVAKEKYGYNTGGALDIEGGYLKEASSRIDFIFINNSAMIVDKYEVIDKNINGIQPSDHLGLYLESRIYV